MTSHDPTHALREAIAKARKLYGLCDPECEGRCRACPQDVVNELIAAAEALASPVLGETAICPWCDKPVEPGTSPFIKSHWPCAGSSRETEGR